MAIHYKLHKNHLREGAVEYYPRVQLTGSVDGSAIAQRMIEQGSTVTLEDIRAVLTGLNKACVSFIAEGYRINLGDIVDIYPSMCGSFIDIDDDYSPLRHDVIAKSSVSRRFVKTFKQRVSVAKDDATLREPKPLILVDGPSGTKNAVYTAGRYATLKGKLLDYNEARNDEGIFFINTSTGAEVRVSEVINHGTKKIDFTVPAVDGEQRIVIRKRFGTSNELRRGELPTELSNS